MSYPGWWWDGSRWQRVPVAKKKRTGLVVVLSVVGGVLLLCLVAGVVAMTGSGSSSTDTSGGLERTDSRPTPGALPTVGRDGQFEFTVVEVEAGVAEVNHQPGNEFWEGETAQGEFVLVTVEVENIGEAPRTFSDFNQVAYDAEDRQFEADTLAGWEANRGTDVWLNDINPGNTVTGILVFDVPSGNELVKLELHDASLSGGVELGLP